MELTELLQTVCVLCRLPDLASRSTMPHASEASSLLPSGEKAREVVWLMRPVNVNVASSSPGLEFQSLTEPTREHDATCSPSGEKESQVTIG